MNTPPMASNAFAVDPREKRIAVLVDREGLGDALLKIPFLRATRRAFPGHRVWWIATHQTAMEDDLAPWVAPLIDRVIANAGLTSPGREIVPRLRRLPPFDVVFDARSRFMTVLLARRYLKHRGFYACLPGFMLSDRLPPGRFTRPEGIAARMLTMVEAATGRAADWSGTFDVSAAAQALAAQRLPDGPRYVGLAPGSREVRKNWPLDRYMALATALAAKGYAPAFLIGPHERAWLATLRGERAAGAVSRSRTGRSGARRRAPGVCHRDRPPADRDRRQRQRRRSSDGGARHAAGEPVRPERRRALGAVRRARRHRARAGFRRRDDGGDTGRGGERRGSWTWLRKGAHRF